MYTQNEWLLSYLLDFYKDKDNLDILKRIVNREYILTNSTKKLSIRIVNWFVTNFAKQHFTVYIIEDFNTGDSRRFFVWSNYKSTENSYSKQMFDPYCREERVLIPYDNETNIETTIGQLHFFKWAIINKVIDYITTNYEIIEKDMSRRLNTIKRKHGIAICDKIDENGKGKKTRKKREELSVNACKSLHKEIHLEPVKIKF